MFSTPPNTAPPISYFQECHCSRLKCNPTRKKYFSAYLHSSSQRVLQLLNSHVWNELGSTSQNKSPVYECLALWIQASVLCCVYILYIHTNMTSSSYISFYMTCSLLSVPMYFYLSISTSISISISMAFLPLPSVINKVLLLVINQVILLGTNKVT
jgi:hypothetical protein